MSAGTLMGRDKVRDFTFECFKGALQDSRERQPMRDKPTFIHNMSSKSWPRCHFGAFIPSGQFELTRVFCQ
jgi:hypothetical protein